MNKIKLIIFAVLALVSACCGYGFRPKSTTRDLCVTLCGGNAQCICNCSCTPPPSYPATTAQQKSYEACLNTCACNNGGSGTTYDTTEYATLKQHEFCALNCSYHHDCTHVTNSLDDGCNEVSNIQTASCIPL